MSFDVFLIFLFDVTLTHFIEVLKQLQASRSGPSGTSADSGRSLRSYHPRAAAWPVRRWGGCDA